MINNTFMNKSTLIKIMHSILFIFTGLYLLESIFLAGLFTNPLLALINVIISIITLVISIIKNERKLALIDLGILLVTLGISIYLLQL